MRVWHKLNPLGSVFGKIWLSFWLSLILIVIAVYFVSFRVAQQYQIAPPSPRHIAALNITELPDFSLSGNDYALIADALASFNSSSQFQWYLVDDAYRMLGSPQPPRRILVMLSEMMEQEGIQVGQWRQEAWLGPITISVNRVNFRLFLRGVPSLPQSNLPFWLQSQWVQFSLALIISGLMSLLLTWSLVRPIDKLRSTVRAFAHGNLEARAGSSVSRRQDEIGELGRDFDDMAGRLEALVAAQQRLLSNVSHELRSPLTRLQVAMGIVRQKAPEGLERALSRIERESDRLENMIAQILKLSRFENAMHQLDLEQVDVEDVLHKVVEDARFEAEPRNIAIEFNGGIPTPISGDPKLLHSVFDNVIRNALRFSPDEGSIQVSLTSSKEWLQVVICDSGPGVPEDKLERLFDPFYRLDQTNSGAGLGLNIALQAVQLHQGRIHAENNSPNGLKVIIDIPMQRAE